VTPREYLASASMRTLVARLEKRSCRLGTRPMNNTKRLRAKSDVEVKPGAVNHHRTCRCITLAAQRARDSHWPRCPPKFRGVIASRAALSANFDAGIDIEVESGGTARRGSSDVFWIFWAAPLGIGRAINSPPST
jgi:hypothetical protein